MAQDKIYCMSVQFMIYERNNKVTLMLASTLHLALDLPPFLRIFLVFCNRQSMTYKRTQLQQFKATPFRGENVFDH